jgi:hypothetical protein
MNKPVKTMAVWVRLDDGREIRLSHRSCTIFRAARIEYDGPINQLEQPLLDELLRKRRVRQEVNHAT